VLRFYSRGAYSFLLSFVSKHLVTIKNYSAAVTYSSHKQGSRQIFLSTFSVSSSSSHAPRNSVPGSCTDRSVSTPDQSPPRIIRKLYGLRPSITLVFTKEETSTVPDKSRSLMHSTFLPLLRLDLDLEPCRGPLQLQTDPNDHLAYHDCNLRESPAIDACFDVKQASRVRVIVSCSNRGQSEAGPAHLHRGRNRTPGSACYCFRRGKPFRFAVLATRVTSTLKKSTIRSACSASALCAQSTVAICICQLCLATSTRFCCLVASPFCRPRELRGLTVQSVRGVRWRL
jgi:hypothetical protein